MEKVITFSCDGEQLIGICHVPKQSAKTGVLIIAGGNQYRTGSHRQFVALARHLAKNDIPVFRFDYRGMGDSEGEKVGFEGCSSDIEIAIDSFFNLMPDMESVIIWGLCDGAAAAASYSENDQRVAGLILLNPWVDEIGVGAQERALLKHYYFKRLFSKGVWHKIFKGEFLFVDSMSNLSKALLASLRGFGGKNEGESLGKLTLVEQYSRTLNRLRNKALVILSEEDLTASLFRDSVLRGKALKKMPYFDRRRNKFRLERIKDANHTFSNKIWKREVELLVVRWIKNNF